MTLNIGAEAAQILLLAEGGGKLEKLVDFDRSGASVLANFRRPNSATMTDLFERTQAWIA